MTVIFYHTGEGKGNENDCRFRKAAKRDKVTPAIKNPPMPKAQRVSPGACRPLIGDERGEAGSVGSVGSMGVVRRIRI